MPMKLCLLCLFLLASLSVYSENAVYIDVLNDSKYLLNGQKTPIGKILNNTKHYTEKNKSNLVVITAYRNTKTDDLVKVVNILKNKNFKVLLQSSSDER